MNSDNLEEYMPEMMKSEEFAALQESLRAALNAAPEEMRVVALKGVMREVEVPRNLDEDERTTLIRSIISNYTLKLPLAEALQVFWQVAGVATGIAAKPDSVEQMYNAMIDTIAAEYCGTHFQIVRQTYPDHIPETVASMLRIKRHASEGI